MSGPGATASAVAADHMDSQVPAAVPVLLETFLGGRAAMTRTAYRARLERFADFLGLPTVELAIEVLLSRTAGEAHRLLVEYKNAMLERGLVPATVNGRLTTLRSLVAMARSVELVTWAISVTGCLSEAYRDTRGPGVDCVRRLLAAADTAESRAIIHLMFDLGLRRIEVVRLDLDDVNLEAGTILILDKGRRQRIPVGLPGPTRTVLSEWLQVRGQAPGPFFPGRNGQRREPTSVNRLVAAVARTVGVRATPHAIRHTAVTRALELTGGDIRRVARFARHRDIRATIVYDDNRRQMTGDVAALVAGDE